MKVKLGKSFKGNHAKAGQIIDLPQAIAELGIKSGKFESIEAKKKPATKSRKKK